MAAGRPLAEMIGLKISKMKPGGGSGSGGGMPMPGGGGGDEEGDFSAAARACYDAIDAESPDAFETALKSAIKACIAAGDLKKPAVDKAEPDEDDAEDETAKGY